MSHRDLESIDYSLNVCAAIIPEIRLVIFNVRNKLLSVDEGISRLRDLSKITDDSLINSRITEVMGLLKPETLEPTMMGYEKLEEEVRDHPLGQIVISCKQDLRGGDAHYNAPFVWKRYVLTLFLAKHAIKNPSSTLLPTRFICSTLNVTGTLIATNLKVMRRCLSEHGFTVSRQEINGNIYYGIIPLNDVARLSSKGNSVI
ncbi:hypothetical protein COU74_03055 [Candidatus Peregrinibacteria bacterium CG10_big_fil_rev_8_21_14_0_10_36_19]|nr:MAG: hypothetical protein COU74_03055 [Candidatus Peregrinibacteria bacterium CG10_big_fil_rev_8_21_14_0_10_36_19]